LIKSREYFQDIQPQEFWPSVTQSLAAVETAVLKRRELVFRPDTIYRCRGIVQLSDDVRRARRISPLKDKQARGKEDGKDKGQR